MSSSTCIAWSPSRNELQISATTTSQTTTGPWANASRSAASAASACSALLSSSTRTEESTEIIGSTWSLSFSNVDRIAGGAAAHGTHRLIDRGEAVELELAAGARDRVVDVLAQDDAAAVELDFQQRALRQAQGIAHSLGQRDLAAFGHGGFHRCS